MKIQQDKRNYRQHPDKNKKLIKKSVDELGAGRSILIDSDNTIIAGNGVFEQWDNKPIKIVESDGSELIVVKRTDLKPNDEKRKLLALADNKTSDTSFFDMEMIGEDFGEDELMDWGFEQREDFSNKNKEIDTDDFDDEMILKLKYTEKDYLLVKEQLQKIADTPEQAVWKLLGNE